MNELSAEQVAIIAARQEACWQMGDGMTDGELFARHGSGWRTYRRPE